MSAGARQAAIDALRKDEDVIVIEKSRWFRNLHSTIRHAATRKNFEDYLYDPLMEIFGTYVKTCSHDDLEATVIPQGCFELRTDSSTRVSRRLSDLLLVFHCIANPDDPQCSESRLGGWVEGKPWVQPPKNPKQKGDVNAGKKPDAGRGNADGQDKEGSGTAEKLEDIAEEDEDIIEEGEVAQEGEVVVEGHDGKCGAITAEVDEECNGVTEAVDIDKNNIARSWVNASEDHVMSVEGASIEDASALVLEPKEVIRRLVEDLPQLCQQAYFAFHHFVQDVIYAIITYGMTFSCFKFIRPADWDSIRGNRTGTVGSPIPIFSNERMVFEDRLNPHLLQALDLMTESLGISYQPSWFRLPPDYHASEPDITVAEEALRQYNKKINGNSASNLPDSSLPTSNMPISSLSNSAPLTSNPQTTNLSASSSPTSDSSSSPEGSSPAWVPTASEARAAASVEKSGRGLRSRKDPSTISAPNLEPVAENGGIKTPELVPEHQGLADAASSDVDDSPLNQRLQSKLALSGRALHAANVPITSGVPGAAGPSTKDTHSLTGHTRAPAVKDSVPGVNSKDKFTTPKDHDKQIRQRRGKARERKDTNSRTEANDPPLPALLLSPVHDAPIGDGVGGSEARVLGHQPTSQEAPGDNSRSVASSRAKSHKRKGRPSSPLRADSLDPDPTGSDASTLAGPSKKRRLVPPNADEQPAGNGTGGPSNISRMEADRSIRAAGARGDAAAERVHDPLTVREPTRPRNVYASQAASEKRARYRTKPAAGTTETTGNTFAEPAAPARRSAIGTRSTTESSRAQVRNPPLPQRQDTTKNNKSRK